MFKWYYDKIEISWIFKFITLSSVKDQKRWLLFGNICIGYRDICRDHWNLVAYSYKKCGSQTDFKIFGDFKLVKHLTRPQTQPNKLISLLDNANEAPLESIKTEHQRWPAKPLTSWKCTTQYAMAAKLLCSYYRAHQVESYCKGSSISE